MLQWAVVLLGFGLDLTVVLKTGKQSLPIIVCTIAVSLLIAFVLHKALRIPSKISTLVGGWFLHLRRLRHCRHRACD